MSIKKLGRYDLIRVLGKGAMGLVYEGRDPNLDRKVAIKTIKVENLSEEAAAEYEIRFRTEARSAARLQHPNIVSVYDSDRDGDVAFLVMEFIKGDDLKHHLDKGELYTLEQSVGIMDDLLSALDYAHRQAIVHRDIKPANLLMQADGRVKLTDFGVARIQDSGEATRTQGSIVGTLKYMSPEQVQGRPIDARADLFAAGIVLYQLLTGKRPFDGDSDFSTIQQIVNHEPAAPTSFNPKLPAALDAVMAKALRKNRDLRYSTAQEFAAALAEATRQAADSTIVPPAGQPAKGRNSTWTGTIRADEALVSQSATGTASTVTQELELVYWKDIKDSVDAEDIELFLGKFPTGVYADLARRRLRKLVDDSGTGTLVVPHSAGQMEPTLLLPKTEAAASAGQAWQALATSQASQAVQAVQAVQAATPTPAAGAPDDTEATVLRPAAPPVVSAPPAHSPAAAAPAPATAAAANPPAAAKPASRRLLLIGAALAVLAAAGIAVLSRGTPAPAAAITAAEAPASSPALAASAAPPPAAVAVAAAPASTPASMPIVAAQPAASRPLVAAIIARKASASADKAAPDKTVKPAPAKANATAARASEEPAAAAAAAHADAGGPRQACESRMLIAFQVCMAEQCAKPAFANHTICVARRAMDQKRREAEQLRN